MLSLVFQSTTHQIKPSMSVSPYFFPWWQGADWNLPCGITSFSEGENTSKGPGMLSILHSSYCAHVQKGQGILLNLLWILATLTTAENCTMMSTEEIIYYITMDVERKKKSRIMRHRCHSFWWPTHHTPVISWHNHCNLMISPSECILDTVLTVQLELCKKKRACRGPSIVHYLHSEISYSILKLKLAYTLLIPNKYTR